MLDDLDASSAPPASKSAAGLPAASGLDRSSILSSSAGSNALADFFTATPTATASPTPEPTETLVPPTETPVLVVEALEVEATELEPEPDPPTSTPEPPPTDTPVPPTETPVPPTATPTPEPTSTPTPEPSPTPTRTPRPSASATPPAGMIIGSVTRYADSLEGNSLGCTQYGVYDADNPLIIAVSAARHLEWPCGTQLQVCGPAGCVVGVRADSCPGCAPDHLDMSRAGVLIVCGNSTGCSVVIRRQ